MHLTSMIQRQGEHALRTSAAPVSTGREVFVTIEITQIVKSSEQALPSE